MTLCQRDVLAFARVLSVETLNGELDAISEAFQPIAELLAEVPLADRAAHWERFLDDEGLDKSAINRAIDDADPLGPMPEDGAEADGGDWPTVRFGSLPPAAPFPVDVLPGPVARLVIDGADAIGCPRDF